MNNETIKSKLKEIVSAGLVSGVGDPRPGSLCIEAAICLALGEPHGDQPSCVHPVDRGFAVAINDAGWSSPQVRAEALLPLGLAQLGTANAADAAYAAAYVADAAYAAAERDRILRLAVEVALDAYRAEGRA